MAFNEPLLYAAKHGKLAQCEALILKKADVNWNDAVALQNEASFLTTPFRQI